jgi:hypothetical protein
VTKTMVIIVSRPPVPHSVAGVVEFCTVWIHQVVLVKLSNAVLPSSAATTAVAPGGAFQAFRPANGLTSLI